MTRRHGARWPAALVAAVFALAASIATGAAPGAGGCDALTVWVRDGCPHCAAAKDWLATLAERRPEVHVRVLEVDADEETLAAFLALNEAHGIARPGVPTFTACGEVVTGFDRAATTGARIEALLAPGATPDAAGRASAEVVLPWLGSVSPDALGLPLFTIAIGLVDGFNPCAMWALLFLLGILVNVRERTRIAVVAGTFVLVSGLVYFAFMAAWLNVFLLVGYSRALQLAIGGVAVAVGLVHVKDFFAPGQGVSLSVPERAKPGLYRGVRRIMQAENLVGAVVATALLAALVNLVELLCTAGLPALYTQILVARSLDTAAHYGYLALYNLAYVADDALMVLLAIVTLRPHKLTATQGRWLKLVSGTAIVVLGALLVVAPDLLSI